VLFLAHIPFVVRHAFNIASAISQEWHNNNTDLIQKKNASQQLDYFTSIRETLAYAGRVRAESFELERLPATEPVPVE